MSGIERELAELERRVGVVEEGVKTNSEDLKTLDATFKSFEQSLSDAEGEIDLLEIKQTQQDQAISEAEDSVSDNWSMVNDIDQKLIEREENSLSNKGGTVNGPLTAAAFGVPNTDVTQAKGLSLLGGATEGVIQYGAFIGSTVTYGKHGRVQGDVAMYLKMSGASDRGWIFRLGADNVASISGNGDMRIDGGGLASTDMRAYSDRRLKHTIEPIENALDKINQIGGYTFNRVDKEGDKRYAGVIAQEMLKVLPEVVSLDVERDRYAVSYGSIVALLIQGVKEQDARLKAIEILAQSKKAEGDV